MDNYNFFLEIRDECDGSDRIYFYEKPSREEIGDCCEDWVKDGEWGENGARINVYWDLYNKNGELLNIGTNEVDIEPNHEFLIKEVAYPYEVCGFDPEDHEWTSEGEGGCDENPGVWSVGGTGLVFKFHCRKCGLSREEYKTGSQYNPGEHDTVKYDMLDEEQINRLIEIGAMDERVED